MSAREFGEWMAFYTLEPFGDSRADLRMGVLAALTANIARDEKRRSKPYEVDDFMPKFDRQEKEAQPWQDQLALVEMLNAAFGGEDKRKQ
ncbi:MAG TPA: DUF4035 domain-containing protein [Vicinamibacterales bacterium]|nr:DUF4035 domain-containing protein [Vicinamibacterales bacterium]